MNEGLFGQLDIDKLWAMLQACPELIKTYKTQDGAEHHAINVNVGYRKEPSKNGSVAYIQIACKKDDRKYDNGSYYIGDLKQSGQGAATGNQPPMPSNVPWGGAPAPAPQQQQAPQGYAPQQSQQPQPQQGAPMPFPQQTGGGTAPF